KDTDAFNRIMAVLAMPKGTDEEKKARAEAMEEATLYAAQIPLQTARTASKAFPLLLEMASKGNPASASDAGVGALAARAAVRGAALNVKINLASLADKDMVAKLIAEADQLSAEADVLEQNIVETVESVIAAQ
ncbi:MAG: cyclodeaminase/cyclohydrolase family protein, partial [Muribaculaceae bacterium]|nr:cyclodeaminase/cyclohydrolase family protein [Muribaculaceae bacterium]